MTNPLWVRAKYMLSLLQLKSFDTSTQDGRSRERYRRVLLATMTTAITKAISILTGIVSVRLTINYLGTERFGLWMTVTSLMALIAFADLGIGNGLINAVADADGRDDREAMRHAVSTGFFILLGVATLIMVAFALIYPFIPWNRVFNVTSSQAIREVGPAVATFITCFAISIPLSVVQKVQIGCQESFASSLWQCLGSVLGLVGVLVVIFLQVGLPWLVLAVFGGQIVALALSWMVVFGKQHPWLRPHWSAVTPVWIRRVTQLGALFFILQAVGAVAFASDNLVIAQTLGSQLVTQYAVPAQLFTLAPMIMSMFLAPLWPAYGESVARGDMDWVRKTLLRSLAAALLISFPIVLILVSFGPQIIHLWVGDQVAPSFSLLLGFGAWSIVANVGGVVAMLLNGMTVVRFQVITAGITATVAITLKIVLARQIGLEGVVWASVIASTLCTLIPTSLYIPRLLARGYKGGLSHD